MRPAQRLRVLATLGVLLLAGCADPQTLDDQGDARETTVGRELDVLVAHVDTMIRLAEGITDVAAAREAAPTMMRLVQELRELEDGIELQSTEQTYEANREGYHLAGLRLRRFREVMMDLASRELMDPELSEAWLLFLTRS